MRGFGRFVAASLAAAAVFVAVGIGTGAAPAGERAMETKVGFLIPSQCKSEEGVEPQSKGATDAWPAPHTTVCALSPACIESGYGLWVKDHFYRLDSAGHERALEYFKTTDRTSYNKVEITGDFSDPEAVTVERLEMTD